MVNFFGPPKTQSYYNPNSQIRSHPVLRHSKDKETEKDQENEKSDEKGDENTETASKEVKEHEATDAYKKKGRGHKKGKDEPETETEVNTRLNALLYHTSNETVDLYKLENNSSDLLGRLYYDDYDSDALSSPDPSSPLASPNGSFTPTSDYFNSILGHTSATSPSIASTLGSASPSPSIGAALMGSQSSSALGSLATPGSRVRPEMKRIKSFERGISFDTSTDSHRKSLTFKVKHPHFRFRRNNKTFLAGFNNGIESLKAIEWLFDEMIVHGDTVIILQVLDEKQHEFIDKRQANKALNKIELLNTHFKKVSLVFEVVIGKPQKLLKKAIDEYSPAMMIIGTRHYGDKSNAGHTKLFSSKSSMSKHFLECALVPVIIVKPTYNYVELLQNPIESELYFQDWLSSIDISGTYTKDKHKRKTKLNFVTSSSPSSSRSSSYTDMSSLAHSERGRSMPSTKENQPFKKDIEDRGRQQASSSKEDVPKFILSESRSRSRSRSKSRDFSRIFGRHH
mmetsp:Transcript_6612/g.8324  ORF Transcript_6612/g.8324 Transcript_6612/m.8324 type:complete len:511 (-) Transcript_6612:1721-3253(-)